MRLIHLLLLAALLKAAQAVRNPTLVDPAIRNNNNHTRYAKRNRYTWMASINYNNRKRGAHSLAFGQLFCQGTLFRPNMILTAASCLYSGQKSLMSGRLFPQVRVGAYEANGGKYVMANVTITAYHKKYNFGDGLPAYDIAVLKLDRNITGVPLIKLPPQSRMDPLRNGTKLSVIGWGPTDAGQPMAKTLMWTDILKQTPQLCAQKWPGAGWASGHIMCARYYGHGKNTCYQLGQPGDGGAPLFLEGKTAEGDVQHGLVNMGKCNKFKPSIFQSTAHFRSWIEETAKVLNFQKRYTGDSPMWIYFKDQWINFND